MMERSADTIFAPASGGHRAAITIVRISGPGTASLLRRLAGRVPPPRRAVLCALRDTDAGLLDRALVLWFPGPHSYTGEDCAELHLHGGRAILDATADALVTSGARPAEPGEFTRRALLNGRYDVLEAEAIGDLVDAETQAQRRQALRQLEGALGDLYRGWAVRIRSLLADIEAVIDFPDEDGGLTAAATPIDAIAAIAGEIRHHLDDGRRGERLRDGLVFAVIGPPNAGKSSLVNALAGRDVAIVASTPGTTRDVIETRITLGDAPVTLLDTAGLRDAADAVEAEGIRRAHARAASADLVIVVVDMRNGMPDLAVPLGAIVVANKRDLVAGADPSPVWWTHAVSARTAEGLPALRAALEVRAAALTQASGAPPLTRPRHRAALLHSLAALDAASAADLPELRAEELRAAMGGLGRITGHVGVEEILDLIFERFCIGK